MGRSLTVMERWKGRVKDHNYTLHSYHIAGKFGKSSAIHQTKLVVTINNPLADLFIQQTFFHQMLEKSRFAKHSLRQTFLLYGIS